MTTMRTLLPVSALLLSLAFAGAPASAQQQETDCATLPGGIVACGTVTASFGSASAAQGEATGSVSWENCLYTRYPSTVNCDTGTGVAYAGTATGPYWTTTCVKGVLKANGVVVAETLWLC